MFGCLIANQSLLSDAQKARYKGCYCGLCAELKERHGFFGRVALTYDMTFLILVCTSMLEPEETRGMERCMAHPVRRHFYWRNEITTYAADMNVALAYHNCRDDFLDDGSTVGFWESEILQGQYAVIQGLWPRQCAAMERELAALSALEDAELISRQRQGIGKPSRIYVRLPDDGKPTMRRSENRPSDRRKSGSQTGGNPSTNKNKRIITTDTNYRDYDCGEDESL